MKKEWDTWKIADHHPTVIPTELQKQLCGQQYLTTGSLPSNSIFSTRNMLTIFSKIIPSATYWLITTVYSCKNITCRNDCDLNMPNFNLALMIHLKLCTCYMKCPIICTVITLYNFLKLTCTYLGSLEKVLFLVYFNILNIVLARGAGCLLDTLFQFWTPYFICHLLVKVL